MRYRDFIEHYFLIDTPETGKLVPFKFRKVQNKYYDELIRDYDIENKGINAPVREQILKARREGFSSMVLALFAADDILQDNPTESLAVSYKDTATNTFRKRYRLYVTSYFAKKCGYTTEQIQGNVNILEQMAKQFFSIDANDIEMKHNHAHFYCGTASARTGGRGGVLQKVLFSEEAHYPDTDKMKASEIIDGTLRQIDISSGWVFRESTANGYGNYYEQTWGMIQKGLSRFIGRFFGWREMYSEEEFKTIASEFVDKAMLMQEYPETPEEAFISSGTSYFDNIKILEYIKRAPEPKATGSLFMSEDTPIFSNHDNGSIKIWEFPQPFKSYVIGGDTAEGLEDGDFSVLEVIDNQSGKTAAKFKAHVRPDELVEVAYSLGIWYNKAYMGIEVNKDGLWVNTELFKRGYPNLYFREAIDDITNKVSAKVGFLTSSKTRPFILSQLQKMLYNNPEIWNNKDFLEECLTFVRNKMGDPSAMSGKHDDEIMATAIAYEIRRNAPMEFAKPEVKTQTEASIAARLEKLYGKKNNNMMSQDNFI
jgi:hypothetical protein